MTPDEVRMLDNQYALLFIRGERPVKDLKYEILTADGKAEPYAHGDTSRAVNTIVLTFDAQLPGNMPEVADMGYELLSEEDVEKEIAKQEKEEESINGKQK